MLRRSLFALFTLLWLSSTAPLHAITITEDPQFIVMNVANFIFLDWDAPEEKWQAEVKPEIITTLTEIRTELGPGTPDRRLAWSTLLEYTDFAMDEPSPTSPYVIQVRRMMEVSEEMDFPLFVPLNGYQWWNEVPELWNHWDPDGNQTPGCTNDEYDDIIGQSGSDPIYKCKFPELRDPAFREKFIKGYNPENRWNVEWQSWKQPMRLNWRNWGAGGMQLAPPPTLLDHPDTRVSYKDFQTARYEAILNEMARGLERWESAGKQHLFAGLTIGTEVSLNASVTPQDEFTPYGYRSIQNRFCPEEEPTCGASAGWSAEQLHAYRQVIVNEYFTDLAARAARRSIPKQRVYTHVWSEALPGEARYTNYFESAHTLYSRPALSLYGQARNPLGFPTIKETLEAAGHPTWGAAEFSTDKDTGSWQAALNGTLSNTTNPAKIIDIYNWREHKGTAAVGPLRQALEKPLIAATNTDTVAEVLGATTAVEIAPATLRWRVLEKDQAASAKLHLFKGDTQPLVSDTPTQTIDLPADAAEWSTTDLAPGVYSWYIERSSEDGAIKKTSTPAVFTVLLRVSAEPLPGWVEWYLGMNESE